MKNARGQDRWTWLGMAPLGDVTFELRPAMERRKRGASVGVSAGTETLRWRSKLKLKNPELICRTQYRGEHCQMQPEWSAETG